ncbi:MAG: winged helix-turn-helix transcriptional regulator [Enhydrobacter sp.]|nr:winged helix-turn-helix transcriptional regulator [Enhydrobacter sp.]
MSRRDVSDKEQAEVAVEDLSVLVAIMSRLLTGLGRLQPFKDANMGLAEWVALTTLAEQVGINNKMLARNLGVTGQRAHQLCSSLSSAGLIKVSQSAEDNRSNEITITELGKSRMNALNAQLKPLFSSALEGNERSVASASRHIRHVMSVLRVGKTDKPGKANRKERNAKPDTKEEKRAARKRARVSTQDEGGATASTPLPVAAG